MGSDIFGALFASVSGLDAQSTSLSIIANNIANSNTVGYKGTQVEFQTLVSGVGTSNNYASGGVTANNQQEIGQQGLLQSTNSPTDIAIQGSGMFVVNTNTESTGQVLYTRAGSFTQDSLGNFVNTAGYYLQAWPLDTNGRLPGAPGNVTDTTSSADLTSLQTVNVEDVAGKAQSTTDVSVSANLNSAQTTYPGASDTATMDSNNATNYGITANTIILPDPPPLGSATQAAGSITFGVNPSNNDTIVLNGTTWTLGTAAGATQTQIQSSLSATMEQLATDLNASTDANIDVATYTATATGIDITYKTGAVAGNSYTLAKGGQGASNETLSGATLSGASAGIDNLVQGDQMTITTGQNPAGYTYSYGGITYSRSMADTSVWGAGGTPLASAYNVTLGTTGGTAPFTFSAGNNLVTVNAKPPAGLAAGQVVKLSGDATALNGLSAGDMNGNFYVQSVSANSFVIVLPSNITAPAATALATNPLTGVSSGNNSITINGTPPTGLAIGDTISLSGEGTIDDSNGVQMYTAAQLSAATLTVTGVAADDYTVSVTNSVSGAAIPATGGTAATGNISFEANPSTGDTISLNGQTWTFVTSGGTVANHQTDIQGTLSATLAQLASDLTASATAGNAHLTGATYGVSPAMSSTELTITYATNTANGNSYTIGTPTVATSDLSGGVNAVGATGNVTFSAVPTNGENITLDGQTWTFVTDTGQTDAQLAAAYDFAIKAGDLPGTMTAAAAVLNSANFSGNPFGGAGYSYTGTATAIDIAAPASDGAGPNTSYSLGVGTAASSVSGADLSGGVTGVAASGSIPITTVPTPGQSIILNGTTWTFVPYNMGNTTGGLYAAHQLQIDNNGTLASTLTDAVTVLNSGPFGGNTYSNPSNNSLHIVYGSTGTAGNSYAYSAGVIPGPSGATLTGGVTTTNGGGAPATQGGASVTQFINTGGTDGDIASTRLFTGDILDATSGSAALITTPTNYTTAALSFTITVGGTSTSTFTYTPAAPNASLGQFNTLDNLATAISDATGLTARIVNNQLYVAAINGDASIRFANGSTVGTDTAPPLAGIDWIGELGLKDVGAASGTTGRFSTLQGLANLINNDSPGLTATVNNALSAASVKINVNNPLDTITFTDGSLTHTNTGSLLAELGLSSTLGNQTVPLTAGPFGPAYDPSSSTTNMASGAITPQFSRSITVYDSLGAAHNLNVAFLNTGINTWAVEVYSQPSTAVNSPYPDGQVASGTLTFNGDGSLESVTTGLSDAIPITWTDGASPSSITINWGTAGAIGTGATNGMSQFSSAYSVNFVNQNGAQVGSLTGISIGSTGLITASFSNGQTQNLYQIPLASFTDPDQLEEISGNVFSETATSGQVNLQQIGSSSVGTIASSSLEESNVELATQLTNMIVAQQAYQANTKVISTADNLLTSLDQIFQ